MGFDAQGYAEFAEKMRAIGIVWQEAFAEGQVQIRNTPAIWVVVPMWDSVVYRDYE